MLSLPVCEKNNLQKVQKIVFVESKLRHDGSKRGSIFDDFTRKEREILLFLS